VQPRRISGGQSTRKAVGALDINKELSTPGKKNLETEIKRVARVVKGEEKKTV